MKEYIVPIYDDSRDYDEIFVGEIRDRAVEIVRCEKCKFSSAHSQWCRRLNKMTSDNWFCGDGKKKEESE